MSEPLLELDDLRADYGESQVLNGVTMAVEEGTVVSLLGRNGAGKTTTLRSIAGVLRPVRGRIRFDGTELASLPAPEITRRGISYVPEDRQVFPDLTVDENLRMGAIAAGEGLLSRAEVLERFPRLRERRDQLASHLSGGEQQMLAIARALLGDTRLLLLDEPTEGLAPKIVEDVLEVITDIREMDGVTILLVEQNLAVATEVAAHHHILHKGRIVFEGTTAELEADEEAQTRHLGVGTN